MMKKSSTVVGAGPSIDELEMIKDFKKTFKEEKEIDLGDLKEDLVDIDDRLNNVDQKMAFLSKHTNYENHKLFKFMQKQI